MHLRESTHFTRINTLEVLRGSDTTSTSVIEGYSVEATYRWKAGKSHRSYFNSGTTRIPILLSSIPFIVYLLENSFSWQQRPGRPVKLLPGRQNYVCSVLSESHPSSRNKSWSYIQALRHPIEESGSHEGEEAEANNKRKRRSENSYPINERND